MIFMNLSRIHNFNPCLPKKIHQNNEMCDLNMTKFDLLAFLYTYLRRAKNNTKAFLIV